MENFADEFEAEAGAVNAAPDTLKAITEAVVELSEIEEAIVQLEEDISAMKQSKQFIATRKIPDLMAEAQMDKIQCAGFDVSVSDFVNGSLPKEEEKRAAAIQYLEEHDGAGIIKTAVALEFGRSEYETAKELSEKLLKDGYTPTLASSVHAQTLAKYARERLESGEEIDTSILGLFTGRIAKLKKAKK